MRTLFASLPLILAACVTPGGPGGRPTDLRALVRSRAAYDLSCPAKMIRLTAMSPETRRSYQGMSAMHNGYFRVSGCGKQVMYTAWCTTSIIVGETCDAMPSQYLRSSKVAQRSAPEAI